MNRALLGVAAAAATVIVGLGAWALTGDDDPGKQNDKNNLADGGQKTPPPKPSVVKLDVKDVRSVEAPTGRGGSDTSIGKNLATVIDGSPKQVWQSQSYATPKFGNYEEGLGVLLDMGKTVTVSKVAITGPDAGAAIELRVGHEATHALTDVAQATSGAGEFTLTPTTAAKGRYVVVWFTQLPGSLRAELGEVTVYGTAG